MKRYTIAAAALLLAGGLTACSREQRDDVQISSTARQELAEERLPGAIDVTVTYGVATLSGNVPDAETKERAQDIIEDVDGVDRVVNNLRTTAAADAPAGAPRPGMQRAPGAHDAPDAPGAPGGPGTRQEDLPAAQPPVNPNAPSAPDMR